MHIFLTKKFLKGSTGLVEIGAVDGVGLVGIAAARVAARAAGAREEDGVLLPEKRRVGEEEQRARAATLRQQRQGYAWRMGQPTQRATNYTARSNIEPAQIFLHANGQSAPRSGGARDVGRGAGSHTPSRVSESNNTNHKRP